MQKRKLIAGNWKMYKNLNEVKLFALAISEAIEKKEYQHLGVGDGPELLVFPQSPAVQTVLAHFSKGNRLAVGVQNIYFEEKGAFTGELSPVLAKELGASFALAGHSERRQFFGETHESAAKRALGAHKFDLKAVFCVGESLVEREANKMEDVLRAQCAPLFQLAPQGIENFIFAYEPVWAIGTGRTATSEQAEVAQAFLREEIARAWGADKAKSCRILYGGSVKPDNARELMQKPNVDGVLVGGASLDPASFLSIAAAAT